MMPNLPIILRNARFIDEGGSPTAKTDILIEKKSRTVADGIMVSAPHREIDLGGLYVSDGWVDLHAHVFEGNGLFSVSPAQVGLSSGVTTLVDAGSAGALNYRIFDEKIIRSASETIYAYVNVASPGIIHGHAARPGFVGDHFHPSVHSAELAEALPSQYPDSIVGWKARLSHVLADYNSDAEVRVLNQIVEIRDRTALPMMIHHMLSSINPVHLLGRMKCGDVYTHLYHGLESAIFDPESGAPLEAALAARERGVLFDVGHGGGAFRWNCAEKACEKFGFLPDVISSDIHSYNLFWPVQNLATTMSKFLWLGVSPERIIAMVTGNAAKAIHRKLPHHDFTIFDLEEGNFQLLDAEGVARTGSKRFLPLATMKHGRISPCYGLNTSRGYEHLARSLQAAAAF